MSTLLRHAIAVFHSYPQVLLMPGSRVGLFLFFATLLVPAMAISGLLAVIGAYLLARLMRMDLSYLSAGHQTYNPLLVGLFIGAQWQLSPQAIGFILAAGAVTFLITQMMTRVLTTQYQLPVLSIPFVISSWIMSLAAIHYINLAPIDPMIHVINASHFYRFEFFLSDHLPMALSAYFRSVGAILFLPSCMVGLAFTIAITFHSRILLLLSLGGFFLGVLSRSLMTGAYTAALDDPDAFNYILVAMAIGGFFLVPSASSYLLAAIGVVLTTLLIDSGRALYAALGIHAYPLPFNLITIMLLSSLAIAGFKGLLPLSAWAQASPEENLTFRRANEKRYQGTFRTLRLPFHGVWHVWQAVSGPWTHQGPWKHAYDFVITQLDANGDWQTHEKSEDREVQLADFYCFRKPVIAPVSGKVIKVISHLADCQPGRPDTTHPWGNCLVIEDPRGFYIEMSHFAQDSIRVKPGDWINQGAVLGLCGNSGNSPQPHLHIQVQTDPEVGSSTVPFSFNSYLTHQHAHDNDSAKASAISYHSNDNPMTNDRVEATLLDQDLDSAFSLSLDQLLVYEISQSTGTAYLYMKICMAPDGSYYMDTKVDEQLLDESAHQAFLNNGGDARLYFGKFEGTFYLYKLEDTSGNPFRHSNAYLCLERLFTSMPRLPLARLSQSNHAPGHATNSGTICRDIIPRDMLISGFQKLWHQLKVSLLGPFFPGVMHAPIEMHWTNDETLVTQIQSQSKQSYRTSHIHFEGGAFISRLSQKDFGLARTRIAYPATRASLSPTIEGASS